MISKFLLVLTILGLATANLHLNVKYRNIIDGEGALDEKIAQEIYQGFKSLHFERSEYRFKIFFETLKEIRNHNVGKYTWRQGINDFSDMTWEEFKAEKLMAPQS